MTAVKLTAAQWIGLKKQLNSYKSRLACPHPAQPSVPVSLVTSLLHFISSERAHDKPSLRMSLFLPTEVSGNFLFFRKNTLNPIAIIAITINPTTKKNNSINIL